MSKARVLIVDDDPEMGNLIGAVVEDLDMEYRAVTNQTSFHEAYATFDPTVLFIDLNMPDADGIQTLTYLRDQACEADIFMISGCDSRILKAARGFGTSEGLKVRDALEKPIDIDAVEQALCNVHPSNGIITTGEIRTGLNQGQFFPRFQPKLTLDNAGKSVIKGAEALVRWDHPQHGELTPASFIPQVESEGLIDDLTDRVIKSAVAEMHRWSLDGRPPVVAVNLSPVMLGTDLSLPDKYEQIVRDAGFEPSDLTIEITESAVMADVTATAGILTRFRIKGFGLSIDDFGTGYSSLVELYRMPFNELKIDQAFVSQAANDKEADVIVRLLVRLAHDLNMTVCAEGAEDAETLDYLRRVGCDTVQGYVIDRPLLANDFTLRIDAAKKAVKTGT